MLNNIIKFPLLLNRKGVKFQTWNDYFRTTFQSRRSHLSVESRTMCFLTRLDSRHTSRENLWFRWAMCLDQLRLKWLRHLRVYTPIQTKKWWSKNQPVLCLHLLTSTVPQYKNLILALAYLKYLQFMPNSWWPYLKSRLKLKIKVTGGHQSFPITAKMELMGSQLLNPSLCSIPSSNVPH